MFVDKATALLVAVSSRHCQIGKSTWVWPRARHEHQHEPCYAGCLISTIPFGTATSRFAHLIARYSHANPYKTDI